MKEMLGNLADGQIEFYKSVCCLAEKIIMVLTFCVQAMEEWERIIPVIQRIRVDV